MWLKRRLALAGNGPEALLLLAPSAFGAARLISGLGQLERPLAWLELEPELAGDAVAQGNLLAEAVARALGAPLLPHGMPFAYGLAALRGALAYAGPLTLAISGAERAPEMAGAALALSGAECRVVLHFEQAPSGLAVPPDVAVLDAEALRLTREEALELAAGRLAEAEALALLEAARGAIEPFSATLAERLGTGPHLVPGPLGPRPLPGQAPEPDPEALLDLLVQRRRWLEALELAAQRLSARVPEVLAEAGHSYHEQGLHRRLWALLEGLPEALKAHETVRFWRLESAFRLGRHEALRQEVQSYLERHEAPALRALAAGVFTPTDRAEAGRAYRAEPTAFTAYMYGRLCSGHEGAELLRRSVALAEREGRPYEVVRNAGELASKLIFLGEFAASVQWGSWALRECERLGVKDGARRLYIVNNWAYARLLTGDLAGLEALLREGEAQLAEAEPTFAYLFRSTLADYLLASGRPAEALPYYRRNYQEAPRWSLGSAALDLVKALLDLGEAAEALRLAEECLSPVKAMAGAVGAPAILAHGLALALGDPEAALPVLGRALAAFRESEYSAHRIAQASLYEALARQALGQREALDELLFDPERHLLGLAPSGLRLLSGPERAFRPLWARLLGQETPLELRFLGAAEVWLEGRRLELYPQWLEILAALVIRGRPLTLEELLADLYGDEGSKGTLKASLSRLRQLLPISTHPYRLEAACRADFQEVLALLARGELRAAMASYRGPLLKGSDAPVVRATDAVITEALRRAALARRDPEALLELFEHWPDDLELLEAAQQALEPGDPRIAVVRAQLEQVRSDWLS